MGRAILMMAFASCLLTASAGAFATEIYTWTDEDGVTHFSDRRPESGDPQVIEITDHSGGVRYSVPGTPDAAAADPGDPELTPAQQRRKELDDARVAQREQRQRNERMCQQHRERLARIEPARRVTYVDENGQEARMDDDQRVAAIEESQNYLDENCQ